MSKVALSVSLMAAGVIGLSVAAQAADMSMPVKAPPYAAPASNWTGWYIGIDGGYGWGSGDQTAGVGAPDFTPPFSTGGGMPGTVAGISIHGGVFGGHLGYNYQISNWVLGLETSAAWADISGNTQMGVTFPGSAGLFTQGYNTSVKWQATATPRLGIVWNNWLFYGKAGLAAGEVDASTTRLLGNTGICGGGCGASVSATQQRVGWTAGVGAEWALTQNWIFGVEYDYVDLGTQNYAGVGIRNNGTSQFDSENVRLNYSEILGRLSYKF